VDEPRRDPNLADRVTCPLRHNGPILCRTNLRPPLFEAMACGLASPIWTAFKVEARVQPRRLHCEIGLVVVLPSRALISQTPAENLKLTAVNFQFDGTPR